MTSGESESGRYFHYSGFWFNYGWRWDKVFGLGVAIRLRVSVRVKGRVPVVVRNSVILQ